MIEVAVSGAGGRMGRLIAEAVAAAADLTLGALYDPGHVGALVAGTEISGEPDVIAGSDVVVEFTIPDVVLGNLALWRRMNVHAVVGTSGFDAPRLEAVRELWGPGPPNCLIAPNFSIGAVTMMRLAEIAAPHFAAADIIELHHDGKADAPSGTSMATAERIAAAAGERHLAVEPSELVPGATGARVGGIPIHSVRLPGLVAHQQVRFGGRGEILTIAHDTTDRASFLPGVLLAVGAVSGLGDGVTVGLEEILGF